MCGIRRIGENERRKESERWSGEVMKAVNRKKKCFMRYELTDLKEYYRKKREVKRGI